jgi:uncharacterized RmlC-like cupin family protein
MSRVRVIRAGDLSADTAQTPGMFRRTIVDGKAGASELWAGFVTMEPGMKSGAHHHGPCESVIYIMSGHVQLRFGDTLAETAEAGPGDFIFVPAHVVHQEVAVGGEPIESIVVRSHENLVVPVEVPGA